MKAQLTAEVEAGDSGLPVQNVAGFASGDGIGIERAGTNEKQTTVGAGQRSLR